MQVERQAPTRAYDGRLRQEHARATQHRIVEAARALFVEQGYGATTIAAVAERAGVSVPTVYKSFATKGTLAERAYPTGDDTTMLAAADDDEPGRVLERYASARRDELERSGAIAAAVSAGATAGDEELRALAQQRDRQRFRTTGTVAR
jgi:AcrR family transcriptional regulator